MEFGEFERIAREIWETIPETYRAGVDGLIVQEAEVANAHRPGVFTLGECITEDYPSAYGGPDTIRSAVVLYYGSFRDVSEQGGELDWHAEIHETIMHELQHHLEALADENSLADVDYAVDENFKRVDGEPFDIFFFRSGELLEANTYRVDQDVFIEVLTLDRRPFDFDFTWEGVRYRARIAAADADVTYVELDGVLHAAGGFYVVRVLKRGAVATLRAVFRSGFTVSHARAAAERT